jgi:hypothetical protein
LVIKRVLVAAAAALLLGGCSQSGDSSTTATERTTSTAAPKTDNDLARNSAHRTLKIPGESFALTVDYYLTSYDATKWQTLASKDVNVSVHVKATGSAAVPQVLLGSFGAATTLRAVDPGLDGLPVVTMRDTPPAALPGYVMSAGYPYDTVVPVDGYSPALVDRWSYLAGTQPLTEQGLVKAGVYANRLTFDYSLLVRNAGDGGFHKRSVTDSLTVPVVAG